MDQRIINLFDEYTHAPLSRQDFLKRLALLVGSTTAALALIRLSNEFIVEITGRFTSPAGQIVRYATGIPWFGTSVTFTE